MSQSAELSSDESRFTQLQRIQPCLRTCWLMFPALIYFVRNMYGEICFTSKTPLFLLMNFALNSRHWSMTSCLLLPFWWAPKMLHCYVWPLAVLSLFCAFATVWQTSFTTLSSSTFESVSLSAPIQYRAKRQDISQMACNTAQRQYLTLCLGAEAIGNSHESASLISLQIALTAWQIWKGQIWNSKVLQPCNR